MQTFWNREWQQLRKRGLVWLLLLSCVAVTYVIADQARTVEQQRALIQVLQGDSMQLFASRARELVNGMKTPGNEGSEKPQMPNQVAPAPTAPPVPPIQSPHTFQPVTTPGRVLRSI